jgi:fucose 4-O-acetylase-like acetyltransferase
MTPEYSQTDFHAVYDPQAPAGYETGGRDIYLDNAKGLLMLLVVIGHMIAPVRGSSGVDSALYAFIYSFHMPMFALVSGYFSSPDASWRSFRKSALRLVPPYLVFQSYLILLEGSFDPANWSHFSLLEPFNAMWYLVSLLTWRALLPLFSRSRYPILLSLLIALLAGDFPIINRYLSLSRTLVLLPFFLLGYHFRQKGGRRLFLIIPRRMGAVLLFLGVLLAVDDRWVDTRWLWCADAYALMGYQGWLGASVRLLTLLLATVLGLAFFSVVPESSMALSRLGRQTLYIYLLHFLAIRVLYHLGFYSRMTGTLALGALVPLGVLMGFLLSHESVAKVAAPFVDPFSTLMKLRENRLQARDLKGL